jgi:hypothetical protein
MLHHLVRERVAGKVARRVPAGGENRIAVAQSVGGLFGEAGALSRESDSAGFR